MSLRVLCAASTRHRVCAHASCPQVMTSMLTPEFGRRSQISDFYNKLNETDPNARDRAKINHMAAVLLKNRHEREQYAVSEGQIPCANPPKYQIESSKTSNHIAICISNRILPNVKSYSHMAICRMSASRWHESPSPTAARRSRRRRRGGLAANPPKNMPRESRRQAPRRRRRRSRRHRRGACRESSNKPPRVKKLYTGKVFWRIFGVCVQMIAVQTRGHTIMHEPEEATRRNTSAP